MTVCVLPVLQRTRATSVTAGGTGVVRTGFPPDAGGSAGRLLAAEGSGAGACVGADAGAGAGSVVAAGAGG